MVPIAFLVCNYESGDVWIPDIFREISRDRKGNVELFLESVSIQKGIGEKWKKNC